MLNHVFITIGLDDLIALGALVIIGILLLILFIAARIVNYIERKRKG